MVVPSATEPKKPAISPEDVARLQNFFEKLRNREIGDDTFIEFLNTLVKPALGESLKNPELRLVLENLVQPLIGKQVWIRAEKQTPFLVEISPLPELIKFSVTTEGSIKKNRLPGISYDPSILQDAVSGKFNPMSALLKGKIRISSLPELIKMGSHVIPVIEPFKEKTDLKENLARNLLVNLDKFLLSAGC